MNEITTQADAPHEPTSTAAVASRSRELAEVQTRYLMAQRFPRDEIKAIERVKNAFARPGLAERAQYEFAKGGTAITGPSVHALQAVAQCWENIDFGFRELSRSVGPDGVTSSEIEAYAVDLQSRTRRPYVFIQRHWRTTRNGGYKLTDEREVKMLIANEAQRAVRSCLQAVIPYDVVETAMEQAAITLSAKADTSPEAMARMVEAFADFDVTRVQIEKLIQRKLDAISPAQVMRLKRIYQSLRDGVAKPSDFFELEAETPATQPEAAGVAAVKEVMAAKRKPVVLAADEWTERLKACTTADEAEELVMEATAKVSPEALQKLGDLYRAQFPTE